VWEEARGEEVKFAGVSRRTKINIWPDAFLLTERRRSDRGAGGGGGGGGGPPRGEESRANFKQGRSRRRTGKVTR